jgi:hypothetical protein
MSPGFKFGYRRGRFRFQRSLRETGARIVVGKKILWLLGMCLGLGLSIVLAPPAQAASIGNIQVCYYCANNFDGLSSTLDGPVFEINNTSLINITNGVFTASGDSYNVGTIAASGHVVIQPGISNDGGSHPGGFFSVTGTILDTSELGPNADSTPFEFTGMQGPLGVDSGIFTPAATKGLSNDTLTTMNFLGGPGNADGPCSNCFGPKIVADLNISPVPEPSSILLVGSGLMGLLGFSRRKR